MSKELQAMLVKEHKISPDVEEPVKRYRVDPCKPFSDNKAYKIGVVLQDGTKLSLFATSEMKLYPESLCPTDVLKATQKRLDKMRSRFVEKPKEEKKTDRTDKAEKTPEQNKEASRDDGKEEPEKPKLKIAEFERAMNAAREAEEKAAGTALAVERYDVKLARGRFVIDAVLTDGTTVKYNIVNGKPTTRNIVKASVKALIEKNFAAAIEELSKTRTLPDYMTEKTENQDKGEPAGMEAKKNDPEPERNDDAKQSEEAKEEKTDKFADLSTAALFALYVREVMNGPSNIANPELTSDEAMSIDKRIRDIAHADKSTKDVVLDVGDRKIALVWGGSDSRENMVAAAKVRLSDPELIEKLPTDEVAATVAQSIEEGLFAKGMVAVCGDISFSLQQASAESPELQLNMLVDNKEAKSITFGPETVDIADKIGDALQGMFCPEIDDHSSTWLDGLFRDDDLDLSDIPPVGGRE